VHKTYRWAKRVWRHSILMGRITRIYEQNLRIDMVGEIFLFNLHKMRNGIGSKCSSFRCQNNIILTTFWKIFRNDPEPFGIHLPFQTKVTNDYNLINRSNNIIVAIICIVLGNIISSWWKLNITHKHFYVTLEILNSSVGIMNLVLPLEWKVAILLKLKQTKDSRNEVETLLK
jgi:hypothetical protein